jgi:hypothetical protein
LSLVGAPSPTTFTYTVTASSAEGDHSFRGVFSGVDTNVDPFNGVEVGGDSSITVAADAPPDTGEGDTTGDTGTTQPDAEGPSATRALSAASVDAGGQVVVTITADGYDAFGDVAETLPAGFTYVSSDLPDDQVTSVGQTVTLSLVGAPSPTTFTYTVTASSAEGDHSFRGVFSGVDTGFDAFSGVRVGGDPSIAVAATTTPPDTGDGDTGDGDTGTTPPDAGEASASRSFSPDPVDAGGEVTVTITAEGHGSFGEVAETLPDGFTYSSSSLPTDQVTTSDRTVTLSLLGATSPITFTYMVKASSVEGDHPGPSPQTQWMRAVR